MVARVMFSVMGLAMLLSGIVLIAAGSSIVTQGIGALVAYSGVVIADEAAFNRNGHF